MALLHQAELQPSKLELLGEWAPNQSWFTGDAGAAFVNVAAYRFDDPEGEVGVETILLRAGDSAIMQVPLTYRAAPLEGAEAFLIGTMHHSVLGKRWVYDAVGDPVYLQTVASATLNGGHQAELVVQTPDGQIGRAPNALVSGSGSAGVVVEAPSVSSIAVHHDGTDTVVTADAMQVRVHRVVANERPDDSAATTAVLTGTWTDSPQERELVRVVWGREALSRG